MKNIPLIKTIGWGITIILAVVAGTFTLTRYNSEQTIEVLKQQLSIEEKKRLEVEKKLSSEMMDSSIVLSIPAKELASNSNNPEISALADRLEKLESEKRILIEKISNKSVSSLDPRSELSVLIEQLHSEDKEEQGKAIVSLFKLKDPISFDPLVQYFLQSPKRATDGMNPSIGRWYRFFIDVNESSGIEFVVGQLESQDRFHGEIAYEILEREVFSIDQIEKALTPLKDLAIRSNNSSARAYAKILLKKLTTRKEDILAEVKKRQIENDHPKPSLRELIEEILKEVKSIKGNSANQGT